MCVKNVKLAIETSVPSVSLCSPSEVRLTLVTFQSRFAPPCTQHMDRIGCIPESTATSWNSPDKPPGKYCALLIGPLSSATTDWGQWSENIGEYIWGCQWKTHFSQLLIVTESCTTHPQVNKLTRLKNLLLMLLAHQCYVHWPVNDNCEPQSLWAMHSLISGPFTSSSTWVRKKSNHSTHLCVQYI